MLIIQISKSQHAQQAQITYLAFGTLCVMTTYSYNYSILLRHPI